jgi:hypothetical protein
VRVVVAEAVRLPPAHDDLLAPARAEIQSVEWAWAVPTSGFWIRWVVGGLAALGKPHGFRYEGMIYSGDG